MSLVAPPSPDKRRGSFLRTMLIVLLLIVVAIAVMALVMNQQADRNETIDPASLDLESPAVVDGATINVVHHGLGSPQIVLLHDAEVAGSVVWEGLIDELGVEVSVMTVDLPGFGLSSRFPETSSEHTVSSMAELVSEIVRERFPDRAVIFVGAGLGAEVAAELAVTQPEQVSALVMIDADFYSSDDFILSLVRWPFLGPAVNHAFYGAGPFHERTWSPNCGNGGWCPTTAQEEARELATKIRGTNESLRAFRMTPPSSFVPSLLPQVTAPAAFIWSSAGDVPEETVVRVDNEVAQLEVVKIAVWKAHLDVPEQVAEVILDLG